MVRAWRELGRVCGSQLVVLAPPYRSPTSLATLERGPALPLGSVVFGNGDATIAVLAELTALSYRAPWAVPCLALPAQQQPLEPLLMLVTELRDRLVVVHRAASRVVDDWAHLVQCVRRRAVPTAAELARWVARRLRQREVEVPLRHQFEEALHGTPADAGLSVASYSRLFAQYGKYTARDWRRTPRAGAWANGGCTRPSPCGPSASTRGSISGCPTISWRSGSAGSGCSRRRSGPRAMWHRNGAAWPIARPGPTWFLFLPPSERACHPERRRREGSAFFPCPGWRSPSQILRSRAPRARSG